MIDITDLKPFKAENMKLGGAFYLKMDNGEFHQCVIYKEEMDNPVRSVFVRALTQKYSSEGRLYVRINKPFKSFV
jgi:hypothetical protein